MPEQIKDEDQYENLREQGMNQEQSARITEAENSDEEEREERKYENWSREQLLDKAEDVGIEDRSEMDKDELTEALKNH
jgi:hypothetical protein